MMYSTIEIKPNAARDDWSVTYYDLPHEREDSKGNLNLLSFYHFPREMGIQAAFDTLKSAMIQGHLEEIAVLQKSLDKLQKLEIELK
jgi:hypothetical protein